MRIINNFKCVIFKFFRSGRKNEELNIEEREDNKFSDISFERELSIWLINLKAKSKLRNF